MPTTVEYAQLSASVYEAGGAGNTNANWIRADYRSLADGFYAATFQNTETGEVVIAYRGTDGPFDAIAGVQLVAGQPPQQFLDAKAYFNDIKALYPNSSVSVTGHSLGGAMASYVAATSPNAPVATAFNALGIANLVTGDPSVFTNVTNYNTLFDPVSDLTANQIGAVNTVIATTVGGLPSWFGAFMGGLGVVPAAIAGIANFLFGQHGIDNIIPTLQGLFAQAAVTGSPLILDLNGDGVTTLSKAANVHFDLDGNGFAEQSGWVAPSDGLLVWDRNGNGQIDNGSELFGNNTVLSTGAKAANGFAALAELDSNSDGKVDINDANFSQLRVWKDSDGNAVASTGELLTLGAVGVQDLGVNYAQQTVTDAQGNQHSQTGHYTAADGTSHAMDDVWFATDTARTIEKDTVAVSAKIAALPDMAGFGKCEVAEGGVIHETHFIFCFAGIFHS
ncbi:MAG: DUF2974 domain-containing protein [Proteobacteria bacterium]|nr:DUF2974 domain-containing protein [Pseudomonadota bacterium]